MNENYDIQKVEKALFDYVKTIGLSEYIFEGQRPIKLNKPMPTFIVVSVPSGVTDLAAFGRCTSRIEMFVQNDSEGKKKSGVFSTMYQKLVNSFPIQHNTYLFDLHPTIITLGNDNEGYHVQAINITTLIKTV